MRDKKRTENNLLEQAYTKVYKDRETLNEVSGPLLAQKGGAGSMGKGALTGAGLGATVGSLAGPGLGTAIGAGAGAVGGAVAGGAANALKNMKTSDEEVSGGGSADIATIAAQAIAAITELAAAAGANISVTVEIGEQEIEEVEVIDQFNTGYEDVGST